VSFHFSLILFDEEEKNSPRADDRFGILRDHYAAQLHPMQGRCIPLLRSRTSSGGPMEFQMRMRLCAHEIVNEDFRQDSRRNRRTRRLCEGIKIVEGKRRGGEKATRESTKNKTAKNRVFSRTTNRRGRFAVRPTGRKKGLSLSPPLRPSLYRSFPIPRRKASPAACADSRIYIQMNPRWKPRFIDAPSNSVACADGKGEGKSKG